MWSSVLPYWHTEFQVHSFAVCELLSILYKIQYSHMCTVSYVFSLLLLFMNFQKFFNGHFISFNGL